MPFAEGGEAAFGAQVRDLLETVQREMFEVAREKRDASVHIAYDWDAFMSGLNAGGLVLTPFVDTEEQEDLVKERSREDALDEGEEEDARTATSVAAKTLCKPFKCPKVGWLPEGVTVSGEGYACGDKRYDYFYEAIPEGMTCFFTGQPAKSFVLWGRSY